MADVFRRDRTTATTTVVSSGNGAAVAGPGLSGSGSEVVFATTSSDLANVDTNGQQDVFATSAPFTTLELQSRLVAQQANGVTTGPQVLSADGRYVAFASDASNLVPGDTNGVREVFRRDLATGATQLVSVDSGGGPSNGINIGASISGDGRYVSFESQATDLVAGDANGGTRDVLVRDMVNGTTVIASRTSTGAQASSASDVSALSGDGRYVTFASPALNLGADGQYQVFRRDLVGNATALVSATLGGTPGTAASSYSSVSGDGRYVAFYSEALNLVPGVSVQGQVYRKDMVSGNISLASASSGGVPGNASTEAYTPSISADGRFIAFASFATNLVAGDTNAVRDVFVRDLILLSTERVSVTTAGAQVVGESSVPWIAGNGRYVTFQSTASTLVSGDTNGVDDVFVRDRVSSRTSLVSTTLLLAPGNGASQFPTISADGRFVTFLSGATNLVAPDTNGSVVDVLVRANPVPEVTGVSPSSLARGQTATITITGSAFLPSAQLLLDVDFILNSYTVVSESTITASVTVKPTAATVAHTPIVALQGPFAGLNGTAGQCAGCLVVT